MKKRQSQLTRCSIFAVTLLALSFYLAQYTPALAQTESQFFPETGKTVNGKFLQYWRANGGLSVYGYPITDAQDEVDPETGKTFLTQWFERNRFELHPENAGTKYEVLLGLLGKDLRREALVSDPDFQRSDVLLNPALPKEQQFYFDETGHNLRFQFLSYWQQNGGLERFGFPISEQHLEVDPETGKVFTMQWFERARFEFHPENQAPYDILLGLLGNQIKAPKSKVDFVWKVGRGYNQLSRPTGIAADNKGNVYVADFGNNFIQKYDSNGQLLAKRGGPGRINDPESQNPEANGLFFGLWGIAIDSQGKNLYVTDRSNQRVQKFDASQPNLPWVAKWGSQGNADNQFGDPAGIAVDPQGNVYVTDVENDRVQKFDSNGQFLAKWGGEGTGNGQFSSPYGIAIDSQGNIFVADTGNGRIQKFDSTGKFITKWGGRFNSADGEFRFPYGVGLDNQGNVYVADAENQRIQKFDGNGRFITKWGVFGSGNSQLHFPTGVTGDSQGNIYVADRRNHRVEKFDSNGGFLANFGSKSGDDGQFNEPSGAAVDKQGNLYVTDYRNHRVQKFDSSGRFLTKWGSEGTGDGFLIRPYGISVDGAGNVYVVDTGNHRIEKFDSNGRFLAKWGQKGDKDGEFDFGTSQVGGVAADSRGAIYVADYANNRIQKFDSNGKYLGKIGSRGSGDGQFNFPEAIAVDSQDNFYVADTFNNRIQKFDDTGNFLSKFGSKGAGDGQFEAASSIAIDAQGNIYVTDSNNRRVQKFNSSGQFMLKWGSFGSADSQFIRPDGIAIDSQNNVYVAEIYNDRVQKFRQR